jgi:hypothetical protein
MIKRIAKVLVAALPVGALALTLTLTSTDRAAAVAAGPSRPTVDYVLPERPADGVGILAPGSAPGLRAAVWGDLVQAKAIAVLVPGMGHGADQFDQDSGLTPEVPGTLPTRARALRAAGGPDLAVVAWLGYATPTSVPTALAADQIGVGAANLDRLAHWLAKVNPQARTTWVCHSYGSLICAAARAGQSTAPVDAVALVGSPGVQLDRASDLGHDVEVWAGRGSADPIELTGLLDGVGVGFGPDPASAQFGALPIPCAAGANHSDYFRRGSPQLEAIAQIANGTRKP